MSLNIKNQRTHALVRQLARATGTSQTSAVEDAVQRRLDEVLAERAHRDEEQTGRRARIEAVLADFRAELTGPDREALRRAETDLYDDAGLPA